jgi:hypothetical protein
MLLKFRQACLIFDRAIILCHFPRIRRRDYGGSRVFLPDYKFHVLLKEDCIMMRKYLLITSLFISGFSLAGLSGIAADDAVSSCRRLEEKASGNLAKYSLYGEANGPLFFSGISCAIEHRNRQLCAMEMVSFDTTAKVFDFYTGAEIAIGKAYFWLADENNNKRPIVAFDSQEKAEKYKAESGHGLILDYTGLTGREFH